MELVEPYQAITGPQVASYLISGLVPVGFPLLAGLILARQPGNVIGWLLVLPAFVMMSAAVVNRFLAGFTQAPPNLTLLTFLLLWYSNWSWLVLVFPLLLIPLFFPTGRPPSARWRWVAAAVVGEALVFIFMAAFAARLGTVDLDVAWSVPNPMGFLSEALVNALIGPWIACLVGLLLLCVAALFVRYRRAGPIERTQIRWLLFACGLFALVYVSEGVLPLQTPQGERTPVGIVWDLAFWLTIVAIPAAIAIAILRYRLWDIDVIIRRTLIYSALTAVLALAYFGSVLGLQGVFRPLTGHGQNSLVVVLSTLGIAALFGPLRTRIQGSIDRRFYRRKYDSTRTLADFAAGARDETNLEQLTARLEQVVEQTMQPAHVSLWLKMRPGRRQ